MAIELTIYSDTVCPFCYLGRAIVESLRDRFEINDSWVGFELHPETPLSGVLLEERFNPFDVQYLFQTLAERGEKYGMEIKVPKKLINSRLSLAALEMAADKGRELFHGLHGAFFEAYFSLGLDMGDIDVVLEVAGKNGLDPDELRLALESGLYDRRLDQAAAEARGNGVSAIPAFHFADGQRIIGAVDEKAFLEAFESRS